MLISLSYISYPAFAPKHKPIVVAASPIKSGAIPGGFALKGSVTARTVFASTADEKTWSKNIEVLNICYIGCMIVTYIP